MVLLCMTLAVELLTICFLLFTLEILPLPFESELQVNLSSNLHPAGAVSGSLFGEQYSASVQYGEKQASKRLCDLP